MRSTRFVPCLATLGALLSPTRALSADAPLDGSGADHRDSLRATIDEVSQKRFLHGFRLGYLFINDIHGALDGAQPAGESFADHYGVRSPHQFLLGYELTWRMIGHEWLNVLLVTNVMASGMEQSKFFPSSNSLIGFELAETAQIGVGVDVTPTAVKPVHMIVAAGFTPRVGDFYTPIHAFFVPDVDGQHRMGVTIGVNW